MAEISPRKSLPGLIALLLGLIGCIATRVPLERWVNLPPAVGLWGIPLLAGAAGLAIGFVAYLLATVSRRTGRGLPIAGVVVSILAIVLPFYRNGKLAEWVDRTSSLRSAPAPIASPAKPQVEKQPAPEEHPHTIFDMDASSPAAPAPQHSPAEVTPAKSSGASASDGNRTAAALAAVRAAKARLDAARAGVLHALSSDAAYRAAQSENEAADVELKEARRTYPAGSDGLIAVSRAALEKRDALGRIVSDAMSRDPSVMAAQRDLTAAEAALGDTRTHLSHPAK